MTLISCGNMGSGSENVKTEYKPDLQTDMEFRASFCNPFRKNIIELGTIQKEKVIEKFHSIEWKDYLKRMDSANKDEIYYSPSLEVENMTNKNGLSISIVDDNNWYIFYKRPKREKVFFGLFEKMNENYLTEITEQREKDAIDCLNALLRNDLEFLERKIK